MPLPSVATCFLALNRLHCLGLVDWLCCPTSYMWPWLITWVKLYTPTMSNLPQTCVCVATEIS